MPEQTRYDILGTQIDSEETKFINATTISTLKSAGPDGEIIFNSAEALIPGFVADTSSFALTASTAPSYLLLAGGTITGNLTVNGTTTLNNAISVTSSYSSGSTIFGDAISDTHRFTGSVFITGSSLTWNNNAVIASNITSSMSVASASQALTSSLSLRVNAPSSISSVARETYDSSNTPSVDWGGRSLVDNSGSKSIDWGERELIANDGTTIALNWTTPGSTAISGGLSISGSLTLNNSNISTAWTPYTPIWTAASVNPVINNGTIEGWYKLVGKTCFVRGNIVIGTTTTFGSGEWYVSMPFTASHADAILMTANLLDNTTAWYNAVVNGARAGFNYKAPLQYQAVGGTANDVNATQPFTWTNSDRFLWNGSFEIA